LGHGQLQGAHARLHRLGLEAVGVAATLARALVGPRAEHLAALELHRFVEQRLHRLGHSLEAVVDQQIQQFPKTIGQIQIRLGLELVRVTMIAVGHACLLGG
jgi:hypothetical protein